MSDIKIRPATAGDIPGIARFIKSVFGVEKPPETLRWLLKDPENNDRYLSLIALKNDRIICHIGYIRSYYCIGGDKRMVGAHPILWAVDPDFRGKIARKLYQSVLDEMDISLIYEGTPDAKRAYPKLGYKRFTKVSLFRRQCMLPGVFGQRLLRDPLKTARTIKSALIWAIGKKNTFISRHIQSGAVRFERFPATHELKGRENLVSNCPGQDMVKWMLRCPDVESEAEYVFLDNIPKGFLVVYWKGHPNGHSGRIIHLPDMGTDVGAWIAVLRRAETLLVQKGCRMITAMASIPVLTDALHKAGYCQSGTRNVWLYDPSEKLADHDWHLTFMEGDAGYRGV